jgi:hypothetical protein
MRANKGEFVVAVFKNPDSKKAGHIAVVRPAAIDSLRIGEKGPQITQAGFTNYKSTDLRTGFSHHGGAWSPAGASMVRFFAHEVRGETLAGE